MYINKITLAFTNVLNGRKSSFFHPYRRELSTKQGREYSREFLIEPRRVVCARRVRLAHGRSEARRELPGVYAAKRPGGFFFGDFLCMRKESNPGCRDGAIHTEHFNVGEADSTYFCKRLRKTPISFAACLSPFSSATFIPSS
jgi:hypothetical protein